MVEDFGGNKIIERGKGNNLFCLFINVYLIFFFLFMKCIKCDSKIKKKEFWPLNYVTLFYGV